MELLSAEANKLNSLIEEWWNQSNQELEATFGLRGVVTMNEFIRVTQRLRSKGYTMSAPTDTLNILTPEQVRFTLKDLGVIQQYCRDNTIRGKEFKAIIKDRTAIENTIDLEQYSVRIKVRREVELNPEESQVQDILAHWEVQSKAFRLIRRWSIERAGFRIDLSMVRQTSRDTRGQYRWVNNFQQEQITKSAPVYEMEVELIKTGLTDADDSKKTLIKLVGEILRGIQNHTLLITNDKRNRIIEGYKSLVKTDKFRGVQPVTMEIINMNTDTDSGVPNIRNGYNVTDKADGLRCMGYCDSTGELYLIDMGMEVYRTGLQCKACATSLVDGEWITRDKSERPMQQFAIFEIYHIPGGDSCADLPFRDADESGRYKLMQDWIGRWNEGMKVTGAGLTPKTTINVIMKEFLFANAGDSSIFVSAARMRDAHRPYHTDGLIFTSNKDTLPGAGEGFISQFKWKPALDNSVDFLVLFEKDPLMVNDDKIVTGVHPDSGSSIQYKTMRLYVGSAKDPALVDPRGSIMNDIPLDGRRDGKRPPYRPILFNPKDYPDLMASYSYANMEYMIDSAEEYVVAEKTNEPIMDRSIVEFRYDPRAAPGWRWIPMRVRHDKTERFMKGVLRKTMNADRTAESVWNSIHDPVTETMIRSGAETPSPNELNEMGKIAASGERDIEKKYYDRKASNLELTYVKGLREFHNWHVKEHIIFNTVLRGGNKTLIDVAVGKGGDLMKVKRARAKFMLGIDIAGENILDTEDGAYRRYLNSIQKFGRAKMPTCVFVIGDSSKSLIDGSASTEPQDRDILKSIFGRSEINGALPKYIENNASGVLRDGADAMVCMFALHYFFEREESLNGLLQNIKDTVKVGGYFGGCCFDGDRVFEFMNAVGNGENRIGADGDNIIWTLTKKYDNDDYDRQYGCAIDVDFITIGMTHREYLVPFGLFVKKMKEIGFELLSDEEAKVVGLSKGSEMFDETYDKMRLNKLPMPDAVKQFSFLNRWFIFVKKTDATVPIGEASVSEPSIVEAEKLATVEPGIVSFREEVRTLGDTEYADAIAGLRPTVAEPTVAGPTVAGPTVAAPSEEAQKARTIPVEEINRKKYSASEVFQFYADASISADKLKTGYKDAARWLAPFAPWIIKDGDIEYPTMEHYMAAMKYKLASNKPELAVSLFARDGEIHADFLEKRLVESGGRPLSYEKDHQFLKQEADVVKLKSTAAEFKRRRAEFSEIKWAIEKDKVIENAIQQRLSRDAKFKKIVEAAKADGKYLLYYTGSSGGSELGGVRRPDGAIDGDNRIGKTIMRLAGF